MSSSLTRGVAWHAYSRSIRPPIKECIDTLPDVHVQRVTCSDDAGNPVWQRDALGRWTKDCPSTDRVKIITYQNA